MRQIEQHGAEGRPLDWIGDERAVHPLELCHRCGLGGEATPPTVATACRKC